MKNGISTYQLACMMRFGKSALIIKLLLEQFANKRCIICCENGAQRYNKLIVQSGAIMRNFVISYDIAQHKTIDWSKYDVAVFDDVKE